MPTWLVLAAAAAADGPEPQPDAPDWRAEKAWVPPWLGVQGFAGVHIGTLLNPFRDTESQRVFPLVGADLLVFDLLGVGVMALPMRGGVDPQVHVVGHPLSTRHGSVSLGVRISLIDGESDLAVGFDFGTPRHRLRVVPFEVEETLSGNPWGREGFVEVGYAPRLP